MVFKSESKWLEAMLEGVRFTLKATVLSNEPSFLI